MWRRERAMKVTFVLALFARRNPRVRRAKSEKGHYFLSTARTIHRLPGNVVFQSSKGNLSRTGAYLRVWKWYDWECALWNWSGHRVCCFSAGYENLQFVHFKANSSQGGLRRACVQAREAWPVRLRASVGSSVSSKWFHLEWMSAYLRKWNTWDH